MNEENSNKESISIDDCITFDSEQDYLKILSPLEMEWQPKEDITTYELAMCLPYFFNTPGVMPYEVDMELPHFRHFKITDYNK